MIEIVLNGDPRSVPAGLSLDRLLIFLEVDLSRVAVERNREIVRKPLWSDTLLAAGDPAADVRGAGDLATGGGLGR